MYQKRLRQSPSPLGRWTYIPCRIYSGESLWKSGESLKKCGESLRKSGESLMKCGESLKKCGESLKKSGESLKKKGKKSTKKIIAFEVGNIVFGTLSVEYMVEKVWKVEKA
jgi:hypothetical protein